MTQGSGKAPPIFMVGLLVVAGIAIIGWGSPAGGKSSCPFSPISPCLTQVQTGTTTIVFTSASSANGPTITFSPAYTVAPTIFLSDDQLGGTISSTTITTDTVASMQSGGDLPWVNMPAALTEVYGDALGQHRIILDWSLATTFTFGMVCDAASTSGTSYVTLEYSVGGGAFAELNSQQRQPLQNVANCNVGAVDGNSGAFSTIPGAAQVAQLTLAVFGVNGGGVGDTPHFTQFWVEWQSVLASGGATRLSYNLQPCATSLCTQESGVSSFLVKASFSYVTTGNLKVRWVAGILA